MKNKKPSRRPKKGYTKAWGDYGKMYYPPCRRVNWERSKIEAPCGKVGKRKSVLYCMGGPGKGKEKHKNCDKPFTRMHKVEIWLCKIHYLENSCGLYAFKCNKCDPQKDSCFIMDEDDKYTYISSGVVFGGSCGWDDCKKPDVKNKETVIFTRMNGSVYQGVEITLAYGFKIKCWYCCRVIE